MKFCELLPGDLFLYREKEACHMIVEVRAIDADIWQVIYVRLWDTQDDRIVTQYHYLTRETMLCSTEIVRVK